MLLVLQLVRFFVSGVNNPDSGSDENIKIMIDVLCKQHSGLNIVHFNARS